MEKYFANVRFCFLLCLCLGLWHVVVLANQGSRLGEAMPQVVKGEGALAVAFGDAREAISQALVHKADSYFHGGIDMECDHLAEHGHADHDDDHEDCHDGHDHDEAAHDSFDPWRWINSHVRAPDVHRHLGGSETIELMPWFWASVKADPHNIEAWTTTWYVANNMMKDKDLALRVVAEGLEKNPDDPELLICRGRTIYDNGRGEFAAAREAFSAAVAAASRMLQHVGSSEERIVQARNFAQAYLDEMAKREARQ
jgi:hypothetical protein